MSSAVFDDVYAVLLAGGSGTRLWPLSRARLPKHLAPLVGERSLLRLTLDRLLDLVPPQRIVTVGAAGQGELLRRELVAADPELLGGLLLEPAPRNTAAAIALAAMLVAERAGPEAVLHVCPSDHLVRRPERLRAAIAAALPAVREGELATFGIAPRRPETGFGYIRVGEPLMARLDVRRVAEFVEKPPLEQARRMLEAGGHLWNSGMFLFRADRLLAELAEHEPEILRTVTEAFRAMQRVGELQPPGEVYERVPQQPVDRAVMERSRRVVVVPCDPGWSDVGSWQALWELGERDARGNLFLGDVAAEGARNCYVHGAVRLVALCEVEDLVVVDTADALLVGRREGSDGLKRLVERLAAEGRREVREHVVRWHAWGSETRLARGAGYGVRELLLEPDGGPVEPDTGEAETVWTVVCGEVERLAEEATRHGPGEVLRTWAGVRLRSTGIRAARLVGTQLDR